MGGNLASRGLVCSADLCDIRRGFSIFK